MDLKDFVKTSIKDIATASQELQTELAETGVLVNPPVSSMQKDIFEEGNVGCTWRQIRDVDFDVAVVASSAGGGKAALKVWSVEISGGADGAHETSSRLRFSIPIALPASQSEKENQEKRRTERSKSAPRMRGLY